MTHRWLVLTSLAAGLATLTPAATYASPPAPGASVQPSDAAPSPTTAPALPSPSAVGAPPSSAPSSASSPSPSGPTLRLQLPKGLIQPGGGVSAIAASASPAPPAEDQVLLGKITDLLRSKVNNPTEAKRTYAQVVALAKEYVGKFSDRPAAGNVVQLLMGLELMNGQANEAEQMTARFFTQTRRPKQGLACVEALASYLVQIEQPQKALDFVERVLKENPEHPEAMNLQIRILETLINTHQGAKAMTRLEAMKSKYHDPEALDVMTYFRGQSDLELSYHANPKEAAALRHKAIAEYEALLAGARKDVKSASSLTVEGFLGATDVKVVEGDKAGALKYLGEMATIFKGQDEEDLAQRSIQVVSLIGTKAKDFKDAGLDGPPIEFKSYHGKVLLLDFWATWCGPCVEEIPSLQRISRNNKDARFSILSVSLDKTGRTQELRQYVIEHKMPWTHVYDGMGWDSPVVKLFGVTAIPAMFLIDETGTIKTAGLHGHDLEHLVPQEIARLHGKPANPAHTPTPPHKGD